MFRLTFEKDYFKNTLYHDLAKRSLQRDIDHEKGLMLSFTPDLF